MTDYSTRNNETRNNETRTHIAYDNAKHGPILHAVQSLDDQIRAGTGGEPGSGLYNLLDMLAGQFLGVQRSAMPMPKEKDLARGVTAQQVRGEDWADQQRQHPTGEDRPTAQRDWADQQRQHPTGAGEDRPTAQRNADAEKADADKPTRAQLGEMSKDELLSVAEDEKIDVNHNSSKADIINAIIKGRHEPTRR